MINMDGVSKLVISGVEAAAQMSSGQMVLRVVDKILWVIEKCVQWSLPTQEESIEENGKSLGKVELVRPLPWIFFLPGLLLLRLVRFGLNVAASFLDYPTVEPSDMVRVIQRCRRRIRAIKSSGLKSMRQKRLPDSKIARVPKENFSGESTLVHKENSTAESTSNHKESKRKYSELSSDETDSESGEESLLEKIDRLARASSSDADFSPIDTSNFTESSDSETDMSISLTEVQEMIAATEALEKESRGNAESTDKSCDKDHNKLENSSPEATRPQLRLVTSNSENDTEEPNTVDKHGLTTNGVGNDLDVYYSPVSWKSITPEQPGSPEIQDNQIDTEKKLEELNNGEVNEKDRNDYDSSKPSVEAGGEVANGHMKEKQRIRLHSGSSNKHHKNKRGNHGNRKKK